MPLLLKSSYFLERKICKHDTIGNFEATEHEWQISAVLICIIKKVSDILPHYRSFDHKICRGFTLNTLFHRVGK